MVQKILNAVLYIFITCAVMSCVTVGGDPTLAGEVTSESYAQSKNSKGVVLVAVNWGRRWKCESYENAQLGRMGFDRLPIRNFGSDSPESVVLENPSRLMAKPIFSNYALLVEPGEYAISSFDITISRSVSDIGHWIAKRSDLVPNGQPKGGTFKVSAGEVIYVGNFWVDCHVAPKPWRYYTEGRDAFMSHINEFKQKYPYLDVDKVQYRLFETRSFGRDYQLK